MTTFKFSIDVYDDYAIIRGGLTCDILLLIIRISKKEGFTHMISFEDNGHVGFKLVKQRN